MSAPAPLPVSTRQRLSEVRYEIRGELARRAGELEAQGRTLIKLNIGNPGSFGFRAPAHLQHAIADDMDRTDPYTHQQGLPHAREAIAAAYARRGMPDAHADRVFIGNGVSELIDMALRALLNPGDEVLVPSPDYPLWSAATILNDGRPVYYRCRPEDGFAPDPNEIETLVSGRTRAIVLINPNNPSGASYPRALLERIVAIARKHNLLLLVDEIYDQILYDDAVFEPVAPLAGDHPCLTFSGLSKVHRACGWRVGWGCFPARQAGWPNCARRWTCSAPCACAPMSPASWPSRRRSTARIRSARCVHPAAACTKAARRSLPPARRRSIWTW
jgi:Aspartate/tyrosine/aromatic aminotransferase